MSGVTGRAGGRGGYWSRALPSLEPEAVLRRVRPPFCPCRARIRASKG